MSMSQGWAPVASCPLEGSPRLASGSEPGSFQIIASALGLGRVRFCMCPLRVESLFPTALWLSCTQAPLPSSPDAWGLVFLVLEPQAGEPNVGLRPLVPWGEPLQLCLSSCLWVTYMGCGSWLYRISTPPPLLPILLRFPFISLVS